MIANTHLTEKFNRKTLKMTILCYHKFYLTARIVERLRPRFAGNVFWCRVALKSHGLAHHVGCIGVCIHVCVCVCVCVCVRVCAGAVKEKEISSKGQHQEWNQKEEVLW
jgi:hypothetical protein